MNHKYRPEFYRKFKNFFNFFSVDDSLSDSNNDEKDHSLYEPSHESFIDDSDEFEIFDSDDELDLREFESYRYLN